MRVFKYLLLLTLLFTLSSCAAMRGGSGGEQLTVRIGEAEKGVIDSDIQRESRALHAFLVGQLSYQEEDVDTAITALSETSDLLKAPQPVIHVQLAQLSLHEGDFDRALNEVRKALAEQPNDIYLRFYEAGILDTMGRFEESAESYKKIIAMEPSADAAVLLSSVYYRAGKLPEAIEALNSVKTDDSSLQLYQSLLYEESKRPDLAARILRDHIKKERDNVIVDFVLIRNLLLNDDLAGAQKHAKNMAAFYKDNPVVQKVAEASSYVSTPEAFLALIGFTPTAEEEFKNMRLELALREIQDRQFREALRDLMLHLAIHPEDSTARYYLASIFAGAGKRKLAVKEIFKIQPGQEMYVKGRTFAAFILRQDGDLELAERAAREALEEEPNNQKIISYLVLILRGSGKYREAEELLAEAVKKEPNNDRLLFSYAVVLNDLGREEESLEMMKRVIGVNPEHSDALNFVAYAYAERGENLDEALTLASRALSLRPNDGFYMDTLGWVYFKLGRLEEAEQTLRRAMRLTDEDVVIAEHYGDILKELGKKTEALEVYTLAVEKARDHRDPDEDMVEARSRMEKKMKELMN